MRKRVIVGVALLALMAMVVPVYAQSAAELSQVEREIEALKSQINSARAESARVGELLTAAQSRLSEVNGALGAAEANVASIQAQIESQEARIDAIQAELHMVEVQLLETTRSIDSTERALAIQAVELYMNASMPVGTLILGFGSVSELAVGWAYADEAAGNTGDLLTTFTFLRAEEDRQRATIEASRIEAELVLSELDAERVVLEAELVRVEGLRAEAEAELVQVQSMLASIRNDIAAAEQHKDGLEAEAARIQAEIAAARRQGGQAPGVLRMPVHGWISSYYGWRVHPIFGTRRMHTGIDLAAIGGTPIYAAEAGVVIIAGSRVGYGNTVVIDHGGGMATLYAHQSRITVSAGESVAAGERIGFVGCTGYCTGDHLHFEVHVNGQHVDPLKYLRG